MADISQLLGAMINYYNGDPRRIQHFIKVHDLARTIGTLEGLDEHTLFTLEAAAAVHDIGIHICELTYGRCDGKLQEQEGPALARDMLSALDFDDEVIDRVCWLVGHHHTYSSIDTVDHQILVEADFLVNLYEDGTPKEAIQSAYDKIFVTETGKLFCRKMFGLNVGQSDSSNAQ
ncbi:MAG: HD domain-containing protein [Acutalibacteraceae bacterium]|nr:HD domain-containing protein [Bacillota bacterium]